MSNEHNVTHRDQAVPIRRRVERAMREAIHDLRSDARMVGLPDKVIRREAVRAVARWCCAELPEEFWSTVEGEPERSTVRCYVDGAPDARGTCMTCGKKRYLHVPIERCPPQAPDVVTPVLPGDEAADAVVSRLVKERGDPHWYKRLCHICGCMPQNCACPEDDCDVEDCGPETDPKLCSCGRPVAYDSGLCLRCAMAPTTYEARDDYRCVHCGTGFGHHDSMRRCPR